MTRARARARARPGLSAPLLTALLLSSGGACTAVAQEAPAPQPEVDPERLRPTDGEALRDAAFTPERLRARRQALLAGLPKGALVLVANPPQAVDVVPYRPDPDFLYLSGQRDPGLWLLLGPGLDTLLAPLPDRRHERWNGPRLTAGPDAAAHTGFAQVLPRTRRAQVVAGALRAHEGPLFLAGLDVDGLGLRDVEGGEALLEAARKRVRSPAAAIAHLRQVKDPGEVALLQRAIDITAAALLEAMASIQPGQYEYEAQATIEYVFARYGAQRPGFTSIVGAGPNSVVLHYHQNRRRMEPGELVVMDVGAELWGYTADVTRTVPVSGRFTPRQREVYQVVLRAQAAGIAAVKPGATLLDVDAAARAVIDEAGYGEAFFHSTSHWLGLDVHDVGSVSRPLAPGMVLTVEPGVYLADEHLGVRIEDDVVVTADGCRVLSDGVPRDPDAIEALMSGRGVGARPVAPLPERGAPGDGSRRFFHVPPRAR